MKIANIYSVKNQKLYCHEECVMILAHLAHQYKKESFNPSSYVIMDNGLYEKSQVSTDLESLVNLADSMPFHINELIIPDVLNECVENIELFKLNLKYIEKYNYKYSYSQSGKGKTRR